MFKTCFIVYTCRWTFFSGQLNHNTHTPLTVMRTFHWIVTAKLTQAISCVLLHMQTKHIFSLRLLTRSAVKTYKSIPFWLVGRLPRLSLCFYSRGKTISQYGFVLLNSSDSRVRPRARTHTHNTATAANLSHWITVISWSPSQQNFNSARTILLLSNRKRFAHTREHALYSSYSFLRGRNSCSGSCFESSCSIRCIILLRCKIWACAGGLAFSLYVNSGGLCFAVLTRFCVHIWVIASPCVFMYVRPCFTVSPIALLGFGLVGTSHLCLKAVPSLCVYLSVFFT